MDRIASFGGKISQEFYDKLDNILANGKYKEIPYGSILYLSYMRTKMAQFSFHNKVDKYKEAYDEFDRVCRECDQLSMLKMDRFRKFTFEIDKITIDSIKGIFTEYYDSLV